MKNKINYINENWSAITRLSNKRNISVEEAVKVFLRKRDIKKERLEKSYIIMEKSFYYVIRG